MEELPLALQYGMTPQQFWEDDPDLIYAYQKEYINDLHKKAHANSLYNYLALSTSLANAFKDKNAKTIEFPKEDVFNPFTHANKQKEKSFISSIDTTENNNQLYQIKKILTERGNK